MEGVGADAESKQLRFSFCWGVVLCDEMHFQARRGFKISSVLQRSSEREISRFWTAIPVVERLATTKVKQEVPRFRDLRTAGYKSITNQIIQKGQ
jgi:hypothetical protein